MEWLHDDEITWELRFFSTSNSWYSCWYSQCDRWTDGLTDWWTDGLSYEDAMMHLVSVVNLLWYSFAKKCLFPLDFTKAWRTDGRTDGQTLLWRCEDASNKPYNICLYVLHLYQITAYTETGRNCISLFPHFCLFFPLLFLLPSSSSATSSNPKIGINAHMRRTHVF